MTSGAAIANDSNVCIFCSQAHDVGSEGNSEAEIKGGDDLEIRLNRRKKSVTSPATS